jgi:hypothetical protein
VSRSLGFERVPLRLVLLAETLVTASRHFVSESVGEFTHRRFHPLKHPSMVRFDDLRSITAREPEPWTERQSGREKCTYKGSKMCAKSAQKGVNKGLIRAYFAYF